MTTNYSSYLKLGALAGFSTICAYSFMGGIVKITGKSSKFMPWLKRGTKVGVVAAIVFSSAMLMNKPSNKKGGTAAFCKSIAWLMLGTATLPTIFNYAVYRRPPRLNAMLLDGLTPATFTILSLMIISYKNKKNANHQNLH